MGHESRRSGLFGAATMANHCSNPAWDIAVCGYSRGAVFRAVNAIPGGADSHCCI
jgi:hypothetical protein